MTIYGDIYLFRSPWALLFAMFDYVLQGQDVHKKLNSRDLLAQSPQQQLTDIAQSYTDTLYRYIRYTFSLDEAVTQDIIQELFLQLQKKIAKVDPKKAFEPRLFRVTHNFTIDRLRKEKNARNATSLPEEEFLETIHSYDGDDLPEQVEQVYKDSLLKVLLHKMSQKNRELIILFYFEHKEYDEIADILGMKKTGIGTLLRRAKEELKEKIGENEILQKALVYDLEE